MYEAFKLLITSFVLPPGGPILAVGAGLLVMHRRPRLGRMLALAGAAVLWLCSVPIVANALVTVLGGAQPLDLAAAQRADAIVILGGGVRPQAVEYGGDTLGRLTLERVRYGAHLARKTGLPVLVTGGAPEPDTRTEADLMREALGVEFGIAVRWLENRATNTRENAINTANLLLVEAKPRILLVMHGFDARRAVRQFEQVGLLVTPAPTQVPRWDRLGPVDFVPSALALQTTHYACYEMLALARDALILLVAE